MQLLLYVGYDFTYKKQTVINDLQPNMFFASPDINRG